MNPEQELSVIQAAIDAGKFLSTPRNNLLLDKFLKAKRNAGFGRIVYKQSCEDKTLIKKARNIAKIDEYFKRDFDELEEDDIVEYRDKLNAGQVFKCKTNVVWYQDGTREDGSPLLKSKYSVQKTDQPLSYRSAMDYKENFVEFLRFVREYVYKESGFEGEDITRFFILRRPKGFNEIKVEFINDDELTTLLNNIRNPNFKALVQLCVMSGARPCEIMNLAYGENLYKNKDEKWIVHLPKIKGVSYKKFAFEVDMYEEELVPYFENLEKKHGDLVFKITQATFAKLMRHYTTHYLGKYYSPKILRKTARMIRTRAGYSHDWINKLMGHEPGSKVQGHYLNYDGLENELDANQKLKGQQYPSLKKDYEHLKLELKGTKQQFSELQEKEKQRDLRRQEGRLLAEEIKKLLITYPKTQENIKLDITKVVDDLLD